MGLQLRREVGPGPRGVRGGSGRGWATAAGAVAGAAPGGGTVGAGPGCIADGAGRAPPHARSQTAAASEIRIMAADAGTDAAHFANRHLGGLGPAKVRMLQHSDLPGW